MPRSQRQYKSGSRWAWWRWTYTPSNYITRLHIFKCPLGALMMHWINGPDPEPDLHDHPVSFLSLILWGSYVEMRCEPKGHTLYAREWWNYIHCLDIHKIVSVMPNTVTFCIVGPKVREWGFHTSDGWVYWRDYNEKYKESA